MRSQATPPISFWGYALETLTHIHNLLPTDNVAKTSSKLWSGKPPSLSHLRVWGYEVFIRFKTNNKPEPRSEKYHFVGYQKKSFGYLLYKPPKNKVFVARRGFFFERELMSDKASGSPVDLEEIQDSNEDVPII